jgi:hypothetical protein
MSITGDIYNIDQTLTGEGVTDLELNTLLVDGLFQNVNANYYKNITSNIQDQLNNISQSFIPTDLSNYVDKTSIQTITGSKTFGVGAFNVNDVLFNNIKASLLATQLGITTGITNSCLNFLVGLNTKINNNVTNLNTSIALKANIDSPIFITQISTPTLILNGTN